MNVAAEAPGGACGLGHNRFMARQLFIALLLLAASVGAARVAAGGVEDILKTAVALACAEEPPGPADMAAALPGGAVVLADEPLRMGEMSFGWRRRFGLATGARVRLTRLAPRGALRRIEAEYAAPHGGAPRPEVIVIAGPDCRLRAARRLLYDADGRAEAIEMLDSALVPTGASEPLNPPAPEGVDPGGVTVALVDSGVNYLLPEIAAGLARDKNGKALGFDYWDLDDRPFDANPARSPFFPQRHGTRVASVILREAPRVRLIPYRYPRPEPARWTDLVADAAAKGARVVNMAMGSNRAEDWGSFVAAAKAHPGLLFVVSAGNDGRDIDRRPVYPAAFDLENMIVVTSADALGAPAPGSNWGKRTVDLLVPGERVPVTDFTGARTTASGASFAAPRLTALAARLAAANPAWRAAELKAAIIARARRTDAAGPTTRHGFLDPAR
ncbi:MAG: S8 family serine peptidase, partial [Alphaproteobacteria bacterium]